MKNLTSIVSIVVLSNFPNFALAGADCKEYPKAEWMSVLDLQKRIVNDYGFTIKRFKIDDECYEIYGWEIDGSGKEQNREGYCDAKAGDIVKKK